MNGTFKDFVDWVVEDNGTVGHTFSNSLIADAMKSKGDLKHLERLSEHIYSGNKERGFWEDKRSAVELSALICSELFEALEGARKPKPINVSFDFDQTLSRKDVQAYAKELIERGVNVWICTSRYRKEKVGGLNDDIFAVAAELGIPKWRVVFTDTEDKSTILNEAWEDGAYFLWHLDDDEYECTSIHDYTNIYEMNVRRASWKQKCDSLLVSCGVSAILHRLEDGAVSEFKAHIKDTVNDELADTVIRCLDALGFYWGQTTDRKPDLFAYYLDTVEFEANAGGKEYAKMQHDLQVQGVKQPTIIAEVHAITRSLMNAAVQPNRDEFIVALLATIYYVGQFAAAKDIDLASHIKAKLLYNATRPYKHGKKF